MVEWTRWKIVGAALSLVISAIVGPLLVYEYVNRPLIDYKFESYDYYDFHFGAETVNLKICNRGE